MFTENGPHATPSNLADNSVVRNPSCVGQIFQRVGGIVIDELVSHRGFSPPALGRIATTNNSALRLHSVFILVNNNHGANSRVNLASGRTSSVYTRLSWRNGLSNSQRDFRWKLCVLTSGET